MNNVMRMSQSEISTSRNFSDFEDSGSLCATDHRLPFHFAKMPEGILIAIGYVCFGIRYLERLADDLNAR